MPRSRGSRTIFERRMDKSSRQAFTRAKGSDMATQLGRVQRVDENALQGLRGRLRGELLTPEDPDYEDARRVVNGMIDRHPALVVRPTDVADVIAALAFSRDHQMEIAIRGGGHNPAGFGTVEGGLVIDLSRMRGVRVDPDRRTARVDGGALLGDVDHATHAFGLATPTGVLSNTGIGGLTIGGGLGHLTRKLGLTIDNLIEADVVLAGGEQVRASEDSHPDLFWAIRGGGGNFGVVTSFLFRLHSIGMVIAGPTFYDLDQTEAVLRWYQDFIGQAPEDLGGFFVFTTVPPVAPFPAELHMRKVCGIAWTYAGPEEKADGVFAPIRSFGPPLLFGVQPLQFPAWQSAFDPLYPKGTQAYWRADFMNELPPEAIALHARHGSEMPTFQSTMHLYPIDGAAHRVGSHDTAWSHRNVRFAQVIVGADMDPANADTIRDWCIDYWSALHPFSVGGAYVNFLMDEGQERVRAAYRDNYSRLAAIKARYDPANVFHLNQNILPA